MKRYLLTALFCVVLAGCQKAGPTVYSVEGTVTLDGAPLADGGIIMDPVDGVGPSASGTIRDGAFSMQTTAGKKRVEIHASRETGEIDELSKTPIMQEIVPARYNVHTELTAAIAAEGGNRLTFELKSKQ